MLGLIICFLLGKWKIQRKEDLILAICVTVLWILGGIFYKRLILNLRMFGGRAREAFASALIIGLLLFGAPGRAAVLAGVLGGCGFAYVGHRLFPPQKNEEKPEPLKNKKIIIFETLLLNIATFTIFFWAMGMNHKDQLFLGFRLSDLSRFSLYLFQAAVIGSVAMLPLFTRIKRTKRSPYYLLSCGALLGAAVFLQNSAGLILMPMFAAAAHFTAVYFVSSTKHYKEKKYSAY